VRGCTAGGDQGGANTALGTGPLLQAVQCLQERLERPPRQRLLRALTLVRLKRIEPAFAVHPFGFV
jgi:hypothetical protein